MEYISLVAGSKTKSAISWAQPFAPVYATPVIFSELTVVDGGVNRPKLIFELTPPPAMSICGEPLLQLQNIFQASMKLGLGVVM